MTSDLVGFPLQKLGMGRPREGTQHTRSLLSINGSPLPISWFLGEVYSIHRNIYFLRKPSATLCTRALLTCAHRPDWFRHKSSRRHRLNELPNTDQQAMTV